MGGAKCSAYFWDVLLWLRRRFSSLSICNRVCCYLLFKGFYPLTKIINFKILVVHSGSYAIQFGAYISVKSANAGSSAVTKGVEFCAHGAIKVR